MGFSDSYVAVLFDGQKAQTKTLRNIVNPQWNDVYSLYDIFNDFSNVKNPGEAIYIAVWDEGQTGKAELQGKCTLNLPEKDPSEQTMQLLWKVLYDENNRETSGRLRVGVQYIYDEEKFYSSEIARKKNETEKIESELKKLSEYTNLISNPFEIIINQEQSVGSQRVSSGILGKSQEILINKEKGRVEKYFDIIEKMMRLYIEIDKVRSKINLILWVFFALSFLTAFLREDFINVIIYNHHLIGDYKHFLSLYLLNF